MKISKELLDNKFNMIMDNQGRLVLNHQKNPLRHIMNHRDLLGLFKSSHRSCSVKKVFKILQISQKSMCWSLLRAYNFIKETPALVFSSKIFQILKKIYFQEQLEKTTSIFFTSKYFSK